MPHIVRWHWEVSNKYRSPYISITKPAGFFCGPYLGLTLEKCDFRGWFLCIILAIWLIVQKSQGQPTWDASSPGKQWDFNYQPQLPSKWLFLRFFFFTLPKTTSTYRVSQVCFGHLASPDVLGPYCAAVLVSWICYMGSLPLEQWAVHAVAKGFLLGITLQETNISHLGKRKIIFKMPFLGDMLVPWRVYFPVIRGL